MCFWQFSGTWNGVELYSHNERDRFDDTCMRLKITEVNEVSLIWKYSTISSNWFSFFLIKLHDEIQASEPSDPFNYLLSLRYLKLKFDYTTHSLTSYVTLNMTNVGFWSGDVVGAGDKIVVQVMKSDNTQLMLTICTDSKLYTVLLNKNTDDESFKNSKQLNKLILEIRKLKVLSTANLQTNCTAELGEESSATNVQFSIVSVFFLLLARFLTS